MRSESVKSVRLPEPDNDSVPTMPLADALTKRRSGYAFGAEPLPLSTLSTLLRFAVGLGRQVAAYDRPDHPLGLAPSAGGLRSLTPYVISLRTKELPAGVYAYDMVEHQLREVELGDPMVKLRSAYVQPEFAERAPVTLALTADLAVGLAKYPPRHFLTMHVDTGIAVQNLYLVATALDLTCCAVSGFHDEPLAELLRLPASTIPTALFAVG